MALASRISALAGIAGDWRPCVLCGGPALAPLGCRGGCGMGSMMTRPASEADSAMRPAGPLREHLLDRLTEPENGGVAAALIVGEVRADKTAAALCTSGTHRRRLHHRPEMSLCAAGQPPDRSELDRCQPGDEIPARQSRDLEVRRARPRLGRAERLRGPALYRAPRGWQMLDGNPPGNDRRCPRWRRRRACSSATTTSSTR